MNKFKTRYYDGLENCICGHTKNHHDRGWKNMFGKGECYDCTCPKFIEKLIICKTCKREMHQRDYDSYKEKCKDRVSCSKIFMENTKNDAF